MGGGAGEASYDPPDGVHVRQLGGNRLASFQAFSFKRRVAESNSGPDVHPDLASTSPDRPWEESLQFEGHNAIHQVPDHVP